jgi:hypothetical protein
MMSPCRLEVKMKAKNVFETRIINLRKVTMKYDRLIVFIRHDSADRSHLVLALMANTGVFVRVVCALKQFISSFSTTLSIIST